MRNPDKGVFFKQLYFKELPFKGLLYIFIVLLALMQSHAWASQATSESQATILVLGDSLSAAYGIPNELGWVTLLEKQLRNEKTGYKIVNASISGETTDGGLRNLPGLLDQYRPDIVILELGANDGLRGFPLATIERNLRKLIGLSQQSGARNLVIGMHIPPNYGKLYANGFHALFGKVADDTESSLIPFLLEGVATHPELMQQDRLHPTAAAQPQIMDRVWNTLKPMLTNAVSLK